MKQTIRQIFYILNRKQKIRLFIVGVITLIGGAVEMLGISAILPFINAVLSPDIILSNKYMRLIFDFLRMKSTTQFIVFLAVAIILIYIIKNVYIIFMYDIQNRFNNNNKRRISVRLMDFYVQQPYLYFVAHDSAELMRNINTDTTMFFAAISQMLHLFTEGSVCLFIFLFLLYQDKTITIALVVAMGLFMLFTIKVIKKRMKKLGIEMREINVKMNKSILQAFGGIKEIKLSEREKYYIDEYESECRKHANNNIRTQMYANVTKPLMETIGVAALLGIIAVKIISGVDLTYFIPVLSTFAIAAFRVMPSVSRIMNAINALSYNRVAVDKIYRAFERVRKDELLEKKEGVQILNFDKEIRVDNVTFSYPNTNKNVLKDVSLIIPKNKSVAFIGTSGGGKTTLVDVILGVLPPTDGNVYVDDCNIEDNIKQWHKKIGYIPQNIYLSDESIRKNVAFGIKESDIDEEQVLNAIRLAQLEEYINGLPEGLDTKVGERGIRMSGGQRQRIGIARALYNNPDVLVLDEATSALDTDTEIAVMESINNLQGDKTIVIIAHRLTTIQNCDYIYRVQEGNVVRE